MKAKLSNNMLNILRKMNAGARINWNKGWGSQIPPMAHMRDVTGDQGVGRINISTMNALAERGLIAPIKTGWNRREYCITDAGRQAVIDNPC